MQRSEFFHFLLLLAGEGIRCSLAVLTAEVRSVSWLGISGSIQVSTAKTKTQKPNHRKTETQCSDVFALEALHAKQRLQAQPKMWAVKWKAVVAVLFCCTYFLSTLSSICCEKLLVNLFCCQPKVLLPYTQHKCVILNAVAKCQPASQSRSRLQFCLGATQHCTEVHMQASGKTLRRTNIEPPPPLSLHTPLCFFCLLSPK